MKITDVEIPQKLSGRPKDRRGYPIPWTVLIDENGNPHFAINDEFRRHRAISEKRCPLCGGSLGSYMWFAGGPKSAFDPRGAYYDPPMHRECCHYALRVCPYLALPSYAGRIDEKSLAAKGSKINAGLFDPTQDAARPEVFVALSTRQYATTKTAAGLFGFLRPQRPYLAIELWKEGARIDPEDRLWKMHATLIGGVINDS